MIFESYFSNLLNRLVPPRRPPTPAGVRLGKTIASPSEAVVWPDRYRCEHAVAIGKTGTGKTYCLERVAVELAQRGEGFAIFDFHGDLSLSLAARLLTLPAAAQRLCILDPSHPTLSPTINVLDAGESEADRFRRVSEISSILRQRWGVNSFGARTEELLRNSLYALAASQQTFAALPRFLTDSTFRLRCTETVEHADMTMYWRERYEPLSEAMKASFREPILNKVTAFLTEPAARHLLADQRSTIDMNEVMRAQQWLIIRLPKGRLREHAHTLGNLLFAQLQFAGLARDVLPKSQRHTFTLICDEAQNLAENVNDLTTVLAEGRKFGLSLAFCSQHWAQNPTELRGALLSAASLMCFRISANDAQVLAPELSPDRRQKLSTELTELTRGEAIARFGGGSVVRFKVSAMPAVAPISLSNLDELVATVARPRDQIEADLRASVEPSVTARPPSTRALTPEGLDDW